MANGQLSESALAPIAGGELRKDAARAWNAMNQEATRLGVPLRPTGSQSSYRNLAGQQHFWDLYQSGRGNLAARPGTSNHGEGIAVDLATQAMRTMVDRIGAKYGWSKAWSDAPSEWWHLLWREGVWAPPPDPLRKLGRLRRLAAGRLLHHRRERAAQARTGKGPRWRREDRYVTRWYRRVERLHKRAKPGPQKKLLARVLADRDGDLG